MSDEKITNIEEKRAEKTAISTPEDFAELLFSFTAHNCDPDRPYTGQSHTDQGLRGKQEVYGITMRDIADCLALAFARACTEDDEIHRKADDNTLSYNDLYAVEWIDFDPVAVIQCLTCEIEKRMGIFPNVPELKEMKTITIKGQEYEVPDWVRWVAMDADGGWFGYKTRPRKSFILRHWRNPYLEEPYFICAQDGLRPKWRHTLQEV